MTDRPWSRKEKRDGYTRDGYGLHEVRPGQWALAHELAWCIANKSYGVPEGFTVVQECGQRSCINPDHLKLVPDGEAVAVREAAETRFRLRTGLN